MRGAIPYIVAAVVLAAAIFLLPRGPREESEDEPQEKAEEVEKAEAPPEPRVLPEIPRPNLDVPPEPADEPPPPTPHGSGIEGDLLVDDDGHFVAGPEARKFFDSILAASAGQSTASIRARIMAEIDDRLPEDSAEEAEDVLDRYLAYRERVREVDEDPPADLWDRLRLLREIRLAELGDDTADSMFSDVDARDEYAAQHDRISGDPALSPEEREKALADLDSKYPPEARGTP